MQLAQMSNPFSSVSSKKKLINEEIELRERIETEISPLWKMVTVLSYFFIVISGITASIAIGSLLAAFDNNCVLYARLTVRGLDEIAASGQNLTLYEDNIVDVQYGSLSDCTFCEYCSVASAVFGGIWGIMFLQCGRGGVTKRSTTQSWQIIPPALISNVVFFVLSCITFAKTIGGLSFFCQHLRSETNSGELAKNITTCEAILSFQFPGDFYNTNLYLDYILAQVASSVTFFGWFVTLFVLILRCFIPVDFIVYGRRLYEVQRTSAKARREMYAQSNTPLRDDPVPSTSTTSTSIDLLDHRGSIETTSFSTLSVPKSKHSKKLS